MTNFARAPLGQADSVHGTVQSGFEPVRTVFEAVVGARPGYGAALCVYVDGQSVVDLWGGSHREDTLQPVFSVTKGAIAICASMLAQRGILDLDAPVASVWPEFGAAGKDRTPIRWLLSHQAGLPAADPPMSLVAYAAGGPAVNALASQAPMWEPGSAHGYHGITLGTLVGEVCRRLTGRTLGQFFASEVATPLGLDFWMSLPEELEPRVAPARFGPRSGCLVLAALAAARQDPTTLASRISFSSLDFFGEFNTRTIHEIELPAANGIVTARALARMYAACLGPVDGVRLLDEASLARACEPQTSGLDVILLEATRFGLGFQLPFARLPMAGPTSFGHDGAGGALAFGDRDSGMAFGFITDLLPPILGADPAVDVLIAAAKRAKG